MLQSALCLVSSEDDLRPQASDLRADLCEALNPYRLFSEVTLSKEALTPLY